MQLYVILCINNISSRFISPPRHNHPRFHSTCGNSKQAVSHSGVQGPQFFCDVRPSVAAFSLLILTIVISNIQNGRTNERTPRAACGALTTAVIHFYRLSPSSSSTTYPPTHTGQPKSISSRYKSVGCGWAKEARQDRPLSTGCAVSKAQLLAQNVNSFSVGSFFVCCSCIMISCPRK